MGSATRTFNHRRLDVLPVSDDELVAVAADRGQGRGAFDLAGMDDNLATFEKGVEDLTSTLTGSHEQAEVGVRRIAEPADRLELVVRFGSHPACGEVEGATAADGGELLPDGPSVSSTMVPPDQPVQLPLT
ncbi:hypothetical protein GCM10023350_35880 [Nocardioides endophyticus]|uniref:Uncharacterized protein n=1 Tax=Nocardioides endophyticus TaxID=1353775 RepID=A0ABP8Z6J1_9ACTN